MTSHNNLSIKFCYIEGQLVLRLTHYLNYNCKFL